MLFFDTNVLVYAQDPAEPGKREIARGLIENAIARDAFMVSTQVLLEFYATMLHRRLLSPAAALALVRVWAEHEVVTATPDLLVRGFELQQSHGFSVWDALIVQAALDGGCDTLYSEDLQHARQIGGLTVINPFLATVTAVHEPAAPYRVASPGLSRLNSPD